MTKFTEADIQGISITGSTRVAVASFRLPDDQGIVLYEFRYPRRLPQDLPVSPVAITLPEGFSGSLDVLSMTNSLRGAFTPAVRAATAA